VRWARLLVVVVLLGGCSGGRDEDGLPPRPTTSTTVDYSVPAVIDVAYVEKVMAALDHVYGDAIRILAKERQITKPFLEHLVAIYTPSEFDLAQEVWVKDVASGLRGLRSDPGDPDTTVLELLRAERACVLIKVSRSFAAAREHPDVETPQRFIALVTRQRSAELNPTPWLISYDGFEPDGRVPSDPCIVA